MVSTTSSLTGSAVLSIEDMTAILDDETRKDACARMIRAVDGVITGYEKDGALSDASLYRLQLARESFSTYDPDDLAHKESEKLFTNLIELTDSVELTSSKILLLQTIRLAAEKHQDQPVRPERSRVRICNAILAALKTAEDEFSAHGGLTDVSIEALRRAEERLRDSDIKDDAHRLFVHLYQDRLLKLMMPRNSKELRLAALKELRSLVEKHQQTPVALS